MSSRKSRRLLVGLVGTATVAALVMPAAAFAKGPGGGGGGGGGAPGEDAAAKFNLSVPAIFVGADPYGLTCSTDGVEVPPTMPTGTPLSGYFVPGSYYVQGVHQWQAECFEGALSAVAASANWGDNLGGDAKLKVGKPIRVEIGLDAGGKGMTGWTVVKLEDTLDRLSAYGTEAVQLADGTWASQPNAAFAETRIWTEGAWLRVYPAGHPEDAEVDEAASAEINATGKVVYGYNLRVPDIGLYTLEYTFPNVTVSSTNHGGVVTEVPGGTMVTKDVMVVPGGGGGGGGGNGGNGGKGPR